MAVAWPLAARAQRRPSKVPRIGIVDFSSIWEPFRHELRELGYIVTFGTLATRAAKQATTTIPIVMISIGDPIRSGLVASYARPGGNITGNTVLGPDIVAKRLQPIRSR